MYQVPTKEPMQRKLAVWLGTVIILGWLCSTGYAQSNVEVKEAVISGRLIAKIGNGDFVHPTFSPDGAMLVYSRVLARKGSVTTEVLLYNLKTHQTHMLLPSAQADKYAIYFAWVTDIKWPSQRRIEITIHDGDVNSTRLTFNPLTKKLVRKEFLEPGHEQLGPAWRKTREQALSLVPEWPPAVLDSALHNSAGVMPGRGIILQKNHVGSDRHIWFLDFQAGSAKQLISSSENEYGALAGGLSFRNSLIVLLAGGSKVYPDPAKVYLLLCQNGQFRKLTEADASQQRRGIEVKHQSAARVIFLIRAYGLHEKGDNPLFVFDGEQLTRVKELPDLYDAAVSPQGNHIAFDYWEKSNRHIMVKELNHQPKPTLKPSDGKWGVEKQTQGADRDKRRNNAQEKSPETKAESASQKQGPRQKFLTAEDFVNDYGKNRIDRGSGREEVTFLIEINPKLPPYRFSLIPDPDALDRWGDDQRVGRIEISTGRSPAILQTVKVTTSTAGSRFTQTFEAKDVNFDGYLDIAVLDWSGAKCGGYNYWLFDPRSGRYITNSLTGELRKLSFNDMTLATKTREIHTTHWLSVCLCKKIYKIVNGHLVLIYVEEPRLKGEGEDYCKVTIKKRIDGKMRLIKR